MADERDSDFWANRDSFRPLTPHHHLAVRLLDQAADSILSDDYRTAERLIIEADIADLGTYECSITGAINPEIHRFRPVEGTPSKASRLKKRMPPVSVELSIFERDRWRCRFCGVPVVAKKAIRLMNQRFPEAVRWRNSSKHDMHAGLRALCSSLDHLLPHSRGGTNEPDNLVSACGPCQFGRNQWTLEEVGFTDPRGRPPVVDRWDGLMRLV